MNPFQTVHDVEAEMSRIMDLANELEYDLRMGIADPLYESRTHTHLATLQREYNIYSEFLQEVAA